VTVIYAKTLEPYGKLYGAVMRTLTGTVQLSEANESTVGKQ